MESLELAESEILRTMPAGAIVVEKKSGKIVFVNDRFIELMGISPKGSSFKEYALNTARARKLDGSQYLFEQLPLTKALLYGKGTANQEMVLQKPDRTDRIVKVNAKSLNNDKGEIIGAIATFEDITEIKQVEQTLRASEEEYRSLFDNMADGLACCQIILSDEGKPIDFVYLKVNDAFEKITGLKRETVVGKKVTEAIPGTKEAHPELIELYGRVALTGKSENFDLFFKPLLLWLHISAYSKEKGYFVAIFENINVRKKAEEALKESEERFSKAFISNPVALSISRLADGRLIEVNEKYLQLFEFSRQEVVNHSSTQLNIFTSPTERAELARMLSAKGSIHNLEVSFQTKTCKRINALLSVEKLGFKDQENIISTFVDITQQKKAEEFLRASEERYRFLFDSIDEGFCIIEMVFDENGKPVDYRFLEVNAQFENQTGLHEAKGKLMRSLAPDHEAHWFEIYGKVALTRQSVRFVNQAKALNRWYDVFAFPVGEEKIPKVGILFKDITERKKAEEALRESEERFSKAFGSSPAVLTITCAEDNTLVDINETFLKLSEYTREEVIGHTTRELNLFQNPDERDRLFALALQKVSLRNQELIARTKTGKLLNVLFSLEPIDIGGQKHVLATLIDITERKKAESELKENERLYRTLFENTDDGFELFKPLYDEAGNPCDLLVLQVNKAYERQTGLKESDNVGKTVKESIPNIEPYWITAYGNVAKTGKSIHIENYNQNTHRWYDVYAFQYAKDQVGTLFRDITERKKAQEELADSNRRLIEVLESMQDGFYVLNREWNFVFMNKKAAALMGMETKDVIGKNLWTLFPKSTESIREENYRAAMEKREIRRFEYYSDYYKGWLSIAVFPSPEGITILTTDITERKKAEEALKASTERIMMAQQVAHVGTFEWNIQTGVNKWTPELEALYGLPSGGFPGTEDAWENLVYPEDRPLIVKQVSEAMEKGGVEGEWRVVWPDGSVHWLLGRAWVFKDAAGKPLRLIGINIDITERKKAEEAQKENQERFSQIFYKNQQAMALSDIDSKIISINSKFESLFDVSQEKIVGHSMSDFVKYGNIAKRERTLELLKEGKEVEDEQSYILPTGRKIETKYFAEVITVNGKKRFLGMWQDISERKKLEKQVKDSERLAAIGQVAGMVGHDIRNPLQAITGELFLAKTEIEEMPKSPKEEALKESVDLIEKQTGYIDKIVKDLQDYARPLKPELVEVDLCNAVPDALSTVEIPSNIQSEMTCDIPELKLKMDLTFLKRIMINLVNNAIQAMPNGGKLTVRMSSKEGKAVITVEDTGVGIPKEVQDKLFTPLFTTKSKGQGFGLVAIKRMTEALGGTISFESRVGKGAKFIIELPIAQ